MSAVRETDQGFQVMSPRPRFWVALAASTTAAAIGITISLDTGNWTAFARSGAVIVIIGAVVAGWDSLAAGRGVLAMFRHVLSRDRMPSETEGLALMVLGTLIWAFGDLAGLTVN
jgi:hypothetical protein